MRSNDRKKKSQIRHKNCLKSPNFDYCYSMKILQRRTDLPWKRQDISGGQYWIRTSDTQCVKSELYSVWKDLLNITQTDNKMSIL